MDFTHLSSTLFSNVVKQLSAEIQLVRLTYCREEYAGHYSIYSIDKAGNEKNINPGDYDLTREDKEILDNYILSQNKLGIKINQLTLIINSGLTYTIDGSWDQKNHEINEFFRNKDLETMNETNSKQKTVEINIEPNRFQPSGKFVYNQLVLSFDLSEPKITARLFVRLYSLLRIEPEVIYEGFLFSIKDNETGLHFGAGCCATGVGYFANDQNEKTIENIQLFNHYLFSDTIELKECSLSFEHDYGETKIGYSNDEMLEL